MIILTFLNHLVGEIIANRFPGWNFYGEDYAHLHVKSRTGAIIKIMLMHPGGGTAYALSYRAQKIVQALPGGQKPDILAIGHYHKAEFIIER